jgi:hypothetical protein
VSLCGGRHVWEFLSEVYGEPDRRSSEPVELHARAYQVPRVAATVKPRYYVINYYSIAKLNPTGVIPKGTPIDLEQSDDRARLAA